MTPREKLSIVLKEGEETYLKTWQGMNMQPDPLTKQAWMRGWLETELRRAYVEIDNLKRNEQ